RLGWGRPSAPVLRCSTKLLLNSDGPRCLPEVINSSQLLRRKRMTFFKASRLPVLAGLLCLLLMGFAGASYGAVRFDVVGSPTEVINTGRSEVVGSINLIVRGTGNLTGTSTAGCNQIGIIYTNPAMQIDNTRTTGIRIFFSSGFALAFTVGSTTP